MKRKLIITGIFLIVIFCVLAFFIKPIMNVSILNSEINSGDNLEVKIIIRNLNIIPYTAHFFCTDTTNPAITVNQNLVPTSCSLDLNPTPSESVLLFPFSSKTYLLKYRIITSKGLYADNHNTFRMSDGKNQVKFDWGRIESKIYTINVHVACGRQGEILSGNIEKCCSGLSPTLSKNVAFGGSLECAEETPEKDDAEATEFYKTGIALTFENRGNEFKPIKPIRGSDICKYEVQAQCNVLTILASPGPYIGGFGVGNEDSYDEEIYKAEFNNFIQKFRKKDIRIIETIPQLNKIIVELKDDKNISSIIKEDFRNSENFHIWYQEHPESTSLN